MHICLQVTYGYTFFIGIFALGMSQRNDRSLNNLRHSQNKFPLTCNAINIILLITFKLDNAKRFCLSNQSKEFLW